MAEDNADKEHYKFSLLKFDNGLMEGVLENPRKTVGMLDNETVPANYSPMVLNNLANTSGLTLHPSGSKEVDQFKLMVGEPIGTGGMASVHSATQCSLEREVAVKRPRRDKLSDAIDQAMVREARLLSRLDHPNILPVYELAFDDEQRPVILMKRVQGVSWSTLIHKPDHPFWNTRSDSQLETHLKILIQICNAVEYAHSKQIIHRDIKTENVMIGDYGEVYLLDWGLAVELDDSGYYRLEDFCGTPCFAAPEMFSRFQPLSVVTDVYLLGGILHEILTKKPLHIGQTLTEIVKQAGLSARYIYDSNVHPMLAEVANRATTQLAIRRHRSVGDFRKALEDYMQMSRALDLLKKAQRTLSGLEALVEKLEPDGFKFHQLAFESRFAFKRVMELAPDLEGTEEGLARVLELQTLYELSFERPEAPSRIIAIFRSMNVERERVEALEEKLRQVKTNLQRPSELATQIQYRLMEQLQATKKSDPNTDPSS